MSLKIGRKHCFYESAKAIFDRDYPNNQITKINTKLAELRDQGKDAQNKASYDNLIKEADQLFLEEKYQESKNKFNEALSLFENEYYPKKKIFEIDAKLKVLNLEKETVEKYNQLIKKADQLRDNKKWVEAKKIYGNAFNLMPDKEYPQEQINFINEQMKLETQQEFQVQYNKLIKAMMTNLILRNIIKQRSFILGQKYEYGGQLSFTKDYGNRSNFT